MRYQALLCAVMLSTFLFGQDSERNNNTSASSTFPGLTDKRTNDTNTNTPWRLGDSLPLTNPYDIVPANVSKGRFLPNTTTIAPTNIRTLMYSGFNGKILAATQTWFCHPRSPSDGTLVRNYNPPTSTNVFSFDECGPHLDIGYDNTDPNHASAAIEDMFARGFDGFAADISGGQSDCLANPSSGVPPFSFTANCRHDLQFVDTAVTAMKNYLNGNHSNDMQFVLMEDQSGWKPDCPVQNSFQPQCIAEKILANIRHYNSNYFFASPNTYIKDASGNPVLMFFAREEHGNSGDPNNIDLSQCDASTTACNVSSGTTCGGTFTSSDGQRTFSNCWTAIWSRVRNESAVPLSLIFRNSDGFAHAQSNGAFMWNEPRPEVGSSLTAATQRDWQDHFANGDDYVDLFYRTAQCILPGGTCQGQLAFGAAKKGFDRENAPFGAIGQGVVTAQQCGHVWLNSFAAPNSPNPHNNNQPYFDSNHQIPYMLVATWDDYEEGSEIETGIENCFTTNAFPDPNTPRTLDWQIIANNGDAAEDTVQQYEIFQDTPTMTFGRIAVIDRNDPRFVTKKFDVSSFISNPPNWFFVQARAKPSLSNHLSSNVDFWPSWGSVTINGGEQSYDYDPCYNPDIEPPIGQPPPSCPRTMYDSGTVSITVNGFTETVSYGSGSTPNSIAVALVNAFNADPSSPVTATVDEGIEVYFTTKLAGRDTHYSLSTTYTYDTTDFSGPSFWGTTSGATLTGGVG